mmetsp:Transcript_12029/g.28232  ORF Transcript_12029/g.28232 Transcript_12029/m.28232 type:complete len:1096 (+) Transcript_12029:532-3819(+)
MVKFSRKKGGGANGHPDDGSVSDISHDSTLYSTNSKSSAFKAKFLGRKNKNKGTSSGDTASITDGSAGNASKKKHKTGSTPSPPGAVAESPGAQSGSVSSAGRTRTHGAKSLNDSKRMAKDAKSRFNIGLVYLKTGDYSKAQDNLEHSLYCHIQLNGHDAKKYDNVTLFAVASVREKLGECYMFNDAVTDKCIALDHFEEARRLLKSIAKEDAPDGVAEAIDRIEEHIRKPNLRNSAKRQGRSTRLAPPTTNKYTQKYQMQGNAKARELMGLGAAGGAIAVAGATPSGGGTAAANTKVITNPAALLHTFGTRVQKGLEQLEDKLEDIFDSDSDSDNRSMATEAEGFANAMSHLQRDNHRTALNYLISLNDEGGKNADFKTQIVVHVMKVADGAMDSEKVTVATDAYDYALSVQSQDKDADSDRLRLAKRGAIKGHKLLAIECEEMRDYSGAIEHRVTVYKLLDEMGKFMAAVTQLMRAAYLHGERDDYAKAIVVLNDAVRRLGKGIRNIEMMPADRLQLLIQCLEMRAICQAKCAKLSEALGQYDELLPLLAKTQGTGCARYNAALIHKAALLFTMKNHKVAMITVGKYLKAREIAESDIESEEAIVEPKDHLLALDTTAACYLKLGNVDKAIDTFEKKLEFVKKEMPDSKELRGDTMHKLGCLLAYRQQHNDALPYLNEALNTRKNVYGSTDKSVIESSFAVAAASQTVGDTGRALKEYDELIAKMNNVNDHPVNTVTVHNSAGKLLFEDGKIDRAIQSFRQALKFSEAAEASTQLMADIKLNLANGLSAKGEAQKALKLYDDLLKTKILKRTTTFFLTLYNKSLLLINLGEGDRAREVLTKVTETRSSNADVVRGNCFMMLGNLSVSDGDIVDGLAQYDEAMDNIDGDDLDSRTVIRRQIAIAHLQSGKYDLAMTVLEEALEDLGEDDSNKSSSLHRAEIWTIEARLYKAKDDLQTSKNFAKLAVDAYKEELGPTHPITLRNNANLQLLLLAEAEELPKAEAKSIIDAAKYDMEDTLDAFVSLDDLWQYRLDVASLKTNLGLIAVWQGKPKKARKLVRQIGEIEIPEDHPILHQVEILERRVAELEGKKSKRK